MLLYHYSIVEWFKLSVVERKDSKVKSLSVCRHCLMTRQFSRTRDTRLGGICRAIPKSETTNAFHGRGFGKDCKDKGLIINLTLFVMVR